MTETAQLRSLLTNLKRNASIARTILLCDNQGCLWFTDPRYGDKTDDLELDHQSVFRLDPQPDDTWKITRVTFDTTKPKWTS